jgi:hypothetical protein
LVQVAQVWLIQQVQAQMVTILYFRLLHQLVVVKVVTQAITQVLVVQAVVVVEQQVF